MNEMAGLRIGMIGPLPPPSGGMANQTRQLGELLSKVGARVEMVPTNPAYRPLIVRHVPVLRALFRLLPYLFHLWLAAGRNDIFHVMANSGWSWRLFAEPAIRIARARHVPVVVNYRGGEAPTFLARAHKSVSATLGTASLVVPSDFLAEVFGAYGMKCRVVPNIVDLERFRPASSGRELGTRLLVARNLEAIYDNATAVRAFALVRAEHSTAKLTIAGSGPELQSLMKLARELEVLGDIEFVGRLDRDQMAAVYRDSDISINPSLVDNMPNSVLESMASGVPVVSTNVGGVPFIVEHERTALLVPPGDAPAMAQAVLRLLRDRTLWWSLREAGCLEVKRYGWDQVAPDWAQVYQAARVSP